MVPVKRYAVPTSLDLVSALSFAEHLSAVEDAAEYVFDFARTGTIEPFPMLLVSSEIRRLARRSCRPKIECRNFAHMGYAAHMGFFQSFGIDYGNAPGQAKGSPRYIPLTIFETQELERRAATERIEVGDEIERNGKRMAAMLCGQSDGAVVDTLTYSMREVMRNVVEHSRSERFGICAQYWPSKSRVEVAILDRGIGLRQSLSRNPHIDTSTDKKSINYALMPAISGKAFKGSRTKQKGNWANSGFGLYLTNRICRNGGTFFIASGDTGMLLTKSEGKRYFKCKLEGTAIRMQMRTEGLPGLLEALTRYRAEGYEFQRLYEEIVDIDPSSASLMLSDDFSPSALQRLLSKMRLRS